MSLLVCFIVILGNINLDLGLVMRCSSICICVIEFGVNLFLIVTILFIKCLHAILPFFLRDVTDMLSCIMFLGGAFVHVLVNSLTVVQSL